jgi:hypothetical protein
MYKIYKIDIVNNVLIKLMTMNKT